jgi:hypothetical protein
MIVAVVLGAGVAACALAIVLGLGVERAPTWNPYLLAMTAAAVLPAVVLVPRWRLLRRPAHLVVGDDALVFTYPWLLRAPLSVPRSVVRVAQVGHVAALFEDGWIAVPALTPDDGEPNVALFFDEPVAGADVRRSGLGRIHRGEPLVGLVVSAVDPRGAERVLDPFIRQMTTYDEYVVEENLKMTGRPQREHTLAIVHVIVAVATFAWTVLALVRLLNDYF